MILVNITIIRCSENESQYIFKTVFEIRFVSTLVIGTLKSSLKKLLKAWALNVY